MSTVNSAKVFSPQRHGDTARHNRNQMNIHHRATETLTKANSKAKPEHTEAAEATERILAAVAKIQRVSCTETPGKTKSQAKPEHTEAAEATEAVWLGIILSIMRLKEALMNRILAGSLCLALMTVPAMAARFTADDIVRITRVSDPQIAPDGKSIVIVVAHPNFKTDKYESELVLVDIATHSQRALTHDRVVRGYPRWSPTGDRLAYIADDSDHKGQVFVLPMSGGDSLQLTHSAGAVTQFAWK